MQVSTAHRWTSPSSAQLTSTRTRTPLLQRARDLHPHVRLLHHHSMLRRDVRILPSLHEEAEGNGAGLHTSVQAIFVDDDIRELINPSVVKLPLLRVLIRRTGL